MGNFISYSRKKTANASDAHAAKRAHTMAASRAEVFRVAQLAVTEQKDLETKADAALSVKASAPISSVREVTVPKKYSTRAFARDQREEERAIYAEWNRILAEEEPEEKEEPEQKEQKEQKEQGAVALDVRIKQIKDKAKKRREGVQNDTAPRIVGEVFEGPASLPNSQESDGNTMDSVDIAFDSIGMDMGGYSTKSKALDFTNEFPIPQTFADYQEKRRKKREKEEREANARRRAYLANLKGLEKKEPVIEKGKNEVSYAAKNAKLSRPMRGDSKPQIVLNENVLKKLERPKKPVVVKAVEEAAADSEKESKRAQRKAEQARQEELDQMGRGYEEYKKGLIDRPVLPSPASYPSVSASKAQSHL